MISSSSIVLYKIPLIQPWKSLCYANHINLDHWSKKKSKGTHKLTELTKANSESFLQWPNQKWNFAIFSREASSSTGSPRWSERRILFSLQLRSYKIFIPRLAGTSQCLSLILPTGTWNLCLAWVCFKRAFFFKYIIPGSSHNKRFDIHHGHCQVLHNIEVTTNHFSYKTMQWITVIFLDTDAKK